jgi:DNA-binding transcriptional LysR family regulator
MNKLHNHLSHLYLFYNVVRLGSFQAVATKYNLPRSSVSKKIQQLETQVGQRLIQRSTRKLSLTDAGRDLLAASESLNNVLESSQRVIEKHESSPSGTVKISCTVIIGQNILLPLMTTLRRDFPDISLELYFSDDHVDLLEQEIDIAIRIGHLPDSSLMARKICDKHFGCYASPEYLKQHGTPNVPEDLTEHQCVIFKNQSVAVDYWPFKQKNGDITKVRVQNKIATDDGRALVEMARLGLGIIMIDALLIREDVENGDLMPILTDWQHPDTLPVNLVCLGRNYRSRASTTIWEALFEHLQKAMS